MKPVPVWAEEQRASSKTSFWQDHPCEIWKCKWNSLQNMMATIHSYNDDWDCMPPNEILKMYNQNELQIWTKKMKKKDGATTGF